jgi:catechol-2,3-dioxygenase
MGTRRVPVAPSARVIDPSLHIGAVHLAVADLSLSVDFYARTLGFALISSDAHRATMGADGEREALVLSALENPLAPTPHSTGLFHVA